MEFEELYKLACSMSKEVNINDKSSYGQVSAVALCQNNKVYKGLSFKTTCNVGFCAETSIMAQMLLDNETRILKLVAVHSDGEILSPCGKCREQIYQLNNQNLECEIMLKDKIVKLKDLLPDA